MVVSLLSLLLPTGDSPAAPLLLPSPVLVLTLHVGISSMLRQAIRATLGLFLPVQVGTTLFGPNLLIA